MTDRDMLNICRTCAIRDELKRLRETLKCIVKVYEEDDWGGDDYGKFRHALEAGSELLKTGKP